MEYRLFLLLLLSLSIWPSFSSLDRAGANSVQLLWKGDLLGRRQLKGCSRTELSMKKKTPIIFTSLLRLMSPTSLWSYMAGESDQTKRMAGVDPQPIQRTADCIQFLTGESAVDYFWHRSVTYR